MAIFKSFYFGFENHFFHLTFFFKPCKKNIWNFSLRIELHFVRRQQIRIVT